MRNNVALRQLRYIFDLSDEQMISLFAHADVVVTRAQISDWLKKDDDEDYERITDSEFASFLNGFINERRGKREGPQAAPEERLDNNMIFRKLKIALAYKDIDIMAAFNRVGVKISKHEISAFFRNPNQSQYRDCEDQYLRNFMHGLQLRYRPRKDMNKE